MTYVKKTQVEIILGLSVLYDGGCFFQIYYRGPFFGSNPGPKRKIWYN